MGHVQKRKDVPSLFKTFSNPSGDQNLHTASDAATPGAAPLGVNHLPVGILVDAEAGEILHIEDVDGNVNSHTFVAAFYDYMPVGPAILGDETTCSVTVFWCK
jgi:hypothetical protein